MTHSFKHHSGANVTVMTNGKKYIYYDEKEFESLADVEKYKQNRAQQKGIMSNSYELEYYKFKAR